MSDKIFPPKYIIFPASTSVSFTINGLLSLSHWSLSLKPKLSFYSGYLVSKLDCGRVKWESGEVYFRDTEVSISVHFVCHSTKSRPSVESGETSLMDDLLEVYTSLTGKYISYDALIYILLKRKKATIIASTTAGTYTHILAIRVQ